MRKYQWIIILVSIFIIIGLYQSVIELWSRRDIVSERKMKLETLKKENEKLVEQYNNVQSNEFVEREARDKLGLGKAGETVVLIDRTKLDLIARDELKNDASSLPNWKQWWAVFF